MKLSETDIEHSSPKQLVQRAYVLMSFGYIEEALEACDEAARRAEEPDDEVTAQSVKGAMLSASGRPKEAMRQLMGLRRKYGEAILPALYLAEACFLAGRSRRAWKILDGLDQERLGRSPWAQFASQLRATWELLSDVDDLPEPVTVPFGVDVDGQDRRGNSH